MKKNSCKPINPKKYSCYGPKKIRTWNLITKKYSCGSKIPLPPPHNISNGPSLIWLGERKARDLSANDRAKRIKIQGICICNQENACDNLFQLCCAHSFKSRVTLWINPFTLKIYTINWINADHFCVNVENEIYDFPYEYFFFCFSVRRGKRGKRQ